MGIIRDITELLVLCAKKYLGALGRVLGFMFDGSSVVPPPPMPRTKRPAPPKGQEGKKPKPRKYKLVPNAKGTYTLEMYNEEAECYLAEKINIECKEEAQLYIRNLERPTIKL